MKLEYVEGLGEVSFVKRKNSSRITVKIEPYQKIKVSIPYFISYKMAKSYLLQNLHEIQNKKRSVNNKIELFHENTPYKTKWHNLDFIQKDIVEPYYHINEETLYINYPKGTSLQSPAMQELIREAVTETLRKEAKLYLPYRLKELASRYGLRYNKVFIKNIKTQWGSCSYKNNINLNLHIMRLPNHLIDYILIHELCHTVHKNHSDAFWNMLSTIMSGDVKKLQKELRDYSPQIYRL
jgi:hypothetical protein